MIRIEFQALGFPHARAILLIEDPPQLHINTDEEVVTFINRHQVCAIPEERIDLRDLVLSLQRHVHSSTRRF